MKLSLIILWRKFSVVLFEYLIKEDAQNVLLLLTCKPWGTGMILWSRATVPTLGHSHLVFIDPGVKIIGAYYRDVLLAQHLLPVISSNICWMCGRNEVRINEDQMWTTKRRSRNKDHKSLAEIRNRTQLSLQTFVSFYLLNKMLRNVGLVLLVQFSEHLESFSRIWSGIRYIWHKQFDLVFIETPCRISSRGLSKWRIPANTRPRHIVQIIIVLCRWWNRISWGIGSLCWRRLKGNESILIEIENELRCLEERDK